ncbi:P protein [Pelomyxa schiedti]|nr:P protein [Pelomyxa schiedti]
MFVLVSVEVCNRTLVALFGVMTLFCFVWAFEELPTLEEMSSWLDWNTLVLLLSMMMLISVFSQTGAFEYVAWATVRICARQTSIAPCNCGSIFSSRHKWSILIAIGTLTAIASAFLDNCTTVLLFGPISVRIAGLLHCSPKPFLISLIYFCTLGGAMTLVGDPPNLIIGSSFNLGFTEFLLNCMPCIVFIFPFAFLLMYFQFKDLISPKPPKYNPVVNWEDGSQYDSELSLLHHTPDNLPSPSSPLNDIQKRHSNCTSPSKSEETSVHFDIILEGSASPTTTSYIRDKRKLCICSIVLCLVLLGFLLEPLTGLSPPYVSLAGAAVVLLLCSPKDITDILEKVEWQTLLFFSFLFIFINLTTKLDLSWFLSLGAEKLISAVPVNAQLPVAVIFVCWTSGLIACWCNNIAYTVAVIPLIFNIGYNPEISCAVEPLAFTLALGVALSANGTIIAAAPNLILVGLANKCGHKISFFEFLCYGFPFLVMTLVLCSFYCLFVYSALGVYS